MDSIISTFHIDWKIIIAQMINFGVVFVVLYIFALKPLSKLMKERADKIETGLTDAKKCNAMLQKATEEYNQNTVKLRQMAMDAEKELKKDLEKLKRENQDKIKAENDEWTKKRIEQMEIDKKALIESAKSEIVSLAMLSVEKLISDKKDLNNL